MNSHLNLKVWLLLLTLNKPKYRYSLDAGCCLRYMYCGQQSSKFTLSCLTSIDLGFDVIRYCDN